MSESDISTRPSPGQLLRSARGRVGLSFEAIAEQMKMTVTKIKAIEDDNHQPFPADTYLKGYLRNYARIVGINEAEVIDSYEYFVAGSTQQSISESLALASAKSKTVIKKRVLAILLFLLLAILLGYYFIDTQPAPINRADAEKVSAEQLSKDGSADAKALSEVGENSVEHSVQTMGLIADQKRAQKLGNSSSFVPLAAETESVLASAVNNNNAESQVLATNTTVHSKVLEKGYLFSFTDNCWLEVIDSSGKTVISEEYTSGTSVRLKGQGPFNVLIGNARAVSLSYNGQPITITPRKNKNTLRITLKQ